MAKSEIPSYNAKSMTDELGVQFPEMSKKNVSSFVKAINEVQISQLSSGNEIGVNNFGSFTFAVQAPRSGKTPNGVAYETAEKNAIKFKAGKDFASRVAETIGTIERLSSKKETETAE